MKVLAGIIALLVIAGGVYYFYSHEAEAPVVVEEQNIYASAALGVGFAYPDGYFVVERDASTPQRTHHFVMLLEDTPHNRAIVAGEAPETEGPVAISMDVFDNVEDATLEQWVRGNSNSNFKLSPDDKLTETSLGGVSALAYTWDGLYAADAVVVAHEGRIYLFSVTWIDAASPMRSDFTDVLKTVQFE